MGSAHGILINPETPEFPQPCQYVLLTHWSETLWETATAIAKKQKSIIVVNEAMAEQLETLHKTGLPDVSIMPVNTDGEAALPWGSLCVVPCGYEYRFPNDPAPYQANGYVLSAEGHYIYYAGPTQLSPALRDTGKLYKPDVAILPVGENFLQGEDLCKSVMWLGSDIILPLCAPDNDALKADVYGVIDMYTPAICRFLNVEDEYVLSPVEATGRTAGPEARY